MKRAPLVALLLVLVCAVPVAAQSVTVTRPPAPGDPPTASCTKGQACLITWTVSGQPGSKVIVELMDKAAPTVLRLIAPEVAIGNLQYSWTVPNDLAAGQYRIQVRVYGAPISDIGDVFTIKAPGGAQAGGFHGGATPIAPIRILEPLKTAVWTIDETHTIRWNAVDSVKYPLWLFLVSKDHTIPIVDIGKVGSVATRPTSKNWTVTDNLYDQEYCIRITSADNAVQVHSQPFWIKASRIVKFKVQSPAVANKVHWHNYNEASWGVGEPFTTALTPVPDPGGSRLKYGYQRWYRDEDNRGYWLHRSFLKFNLAGVIAQLKHQWTVYRAFVSWNKAPDSPQGCAPVLFCLDAAMGDLNAGMFGPTFASFPKHTIGADQGPLVQMATRWLQDPGKNYGLVVVAQNEGQHNENGQCVTYTTPATMEIEIEEKLNH